MITRTIKYLRRWIFIADLYGYVDYTILNPIAKNEEYFKLCEDALKLGCKSVCVPPSKVSLLYNLYDNLNICTVIGFPLGYSTLKTKLFETKEAINNGANEIDLVVNLAHIKEKRWDMIKSEVDLIKDVVGEKILKVIIETSYLDMEELEKLVEVLNKTRCDFIKTSTGFSSHGAEKEKTKYIVDNKGLNKEVKASGGIRTLEDFKYYVGIGCKRIGVSNIDYLKEEELWVKKRNNTTFNVLLRT